MFPAAYRTKVPVKDAGELPEEILDPSARDTATVLGGTGSPSPLKS